MSFGQLLGGGTGLFQDTEGPVFNENVGGFQQSMELVYAGVGSGVQGNAAFAEVGEQEQAAAFGMGNVVRERAAPSGRVAARRLHLDDVGAEFGQQFGAEGGGDHLAPLNDANALQWRRGHRGRGRR